MFVVANVAAIFMVIYMQYLGICNIYAIIFF